MTMGRTIASPNSTAERAGRPRPEIFGMTLIEITVALAIAAMMTAIVIASTRALDHSALKSAAVEIAGSVKFSYDRAIMEKRIQRLGMDLDKNLFWLDYTEDTYGLARTLARGAAGDRPDDEDPEKRREEEEDHASDGSSFDEREAREREVKRALEGGKAARFQPDTEVSKPRPLPSGIKFSKVWTGHQEESFKSGVAYLHFFRGGYTEPAQIELTDGSEFITVKVLPLTGRVRMVDKSLEDPDVEEADGRDEGDL